MDRNANVVDEFCGAWSSKHLDRLLDYFTPDAVYTNIPIDPPNEGVEAIRKAVEGFIGMSEQIEFIRFERTGAPNEHAGFGKYAAEAKNRQVKFLRRHLLDSA